METRCLSYAKTQSKFLDSTDGNWVNARKFANENSVTPKYLNNALWTINWIDGILNTTRVYINELKGKQNALLALRETKAHHVSSMEFFKNLIKDREEAYSFLCEKILIDNQTKT